MKITNLEMVRRINSLNEFANKKLPQRISYAITRNLYILSKEYSIYDEQLKKIVNSYSDSILKDENGNVIARNGVPEVKENIRGEYNEQLSELLGIDIDIQPYYIDQSVFDYDDNGRYDAMSAKDIMILQSLLCTDKKEGE